MESTLKREQLLFDAALEIQSPAERSAFLDRECGGDSKLRQRIERLLALHERAENFFDDCRPALNPADRIAGAVETVSDTWDKPGEEIGTRIGRYKLLQKIGEGGCGVVYMAEQQTPVRRRVALKIIKVGMDTRSVIARFEAERQALAMMDHPNIARVLDAGETETGRPFFVMELVNGIRITRYCDERQLDTRQRLDLFIQVCRAIQHAHQKGIIHRDIKPSNILITHHDGVPVPKVIDFGIAKAIEGKLTDKTLFTIYGHFIGTPAYMSPEQADYSGLDIDTRSDIYSLGVLLYELLTGKTPFEQNELLASGLDEMRKTLREREPHRPSTRLDTFQPGELTATAARRHIEPPKLQMLLKGDLDWIVMKALEKDRRRRYETANGLVMDVQRFLNNEPVSARPPSRWYRFQKLASRNRGVFAATGAVLLALVVGLSAATWMFFQEREMRRRAVVAEQTAERARANEAELRQQAETREKIAQAAFLTSQGKLAEADKVAAGIVFQEPTLDGAAVLRSLGQWHARNGDWPLAGERFLRALQVDQLDDSDTMVQDFSSASAALAAIGDARRFESFRNRVLTRFAGQKNPALAQAILRACLLLPLATNTFESLQPLAKVIIPTGDASVGSARTSADNLAANLKLENIGMEQPCSFDNRDGVITLVGGGGNIYENTDQFAYAFALVQGDFDHRMRVHSVTPMLNEFTRVGLMARESLSSSGARHVTVAVNANGTFQFIVRS
ncbi:MAG TPA: protein kinase, partial [Candidatus Paceibacterota bacterium]|nr:protein kinase [Candidatus Paceibacterota bacterium]